MTTTAPVVSIAMPVYNVQYTIAVAIRSILAQTFSDWELLIVNDGSTDNTLEVIQRFKDPRIHVWSYDDNLGLTMRLNETIERSCGNYYARMDGDDIAYPQRLERQLALMQARPEMDLVGAWMLVFRGYGTPLGKRTGKLGPTNHNIIRTIPIGHPTFLGRLDWFRKNKYAKHPRHFQDQQLLLSTIEHSRFDIVPEILLGYREETLTIRKQLKYRRSYIQAFPHLRQELGVRRALTLAGMQLVKTGVDIFAIGTGLKYRVLCNRAQPITKAEKQQWQSIWELVNQESYL